MPNNWSIHPAARAHHGRGATLEETEADMWQRIAVAESQRDEALYEAEVAEKGALTANADLLASAEELRQRVQALRGQLDRTRREESLWREEQRSAHSRKTELEERRRGLAAFGSNLMGAALSEAQSLAESLRQQARHASDARARQRGLEAELEHQLAERRQLEERLEASRAHRAQLDALLEEQRRTAQAAAAEREARQRELESRMSMDRALELARWASDALHKDYDDVDNGAESEEDPESAFDAPLGELQDALSMLQRKPEEYTNAVSDLETALTRLTVPFDDEAVKLQKTIDAMSAVSKESPSPLLTRSPYGLGAMVLMHDGYAHDERNWL